MSPTLQALEQAGNTVIERAMVFVTGVRLGQHEHYDYDFTQLGKAVDTYDALTLIPEEAPPYPEDDVVPVSCEAIV